MDDKGVKFVIGIYEDEDVLLDAISSSLSFFGERCLAFLVGERYKNYYRYIYLILILIGSTSSLQFVISVIDLSYGIMAFPTMISAIYLAPEVEKHSKKYFKKLR